MGKNKSELISKVALILGVTENMVKHRFTLEDQVEMLVEHIERMEEYKGVHEVIPHD